MGRWWKAGEFKVAFTKAPAQSITAQLDNLRKSNAIPQVMILIYLPAEAFIYFDNIDHNFPKQIEYVLKVENTDVFIQGFHTKTKNLEEKISELETERDAAIAERDAAIAEKDALIEKAKAETAALKGILALFQTLSSSILSGETNYTYENSKLEKIMSLLNQSSEDRAKYDPHYSEFIPSIDNLPKLNNLRNPLVATNELTTGAPVDIKGPETRKVPEIGDIEQEKDSTDESYEDDRYKDRR